MKSTDTVIGLFGMGSDGHIAGVLPNTLGVLSTEVVCGYISDKFTRVTLTLDTLKKIDASVITAILNTSLYYWWFLLFSDCRHLNLREIESFHAGLDTMTEVTKKKLAEILGKLMKDFKKHAIRTETVYQTTGKVVYDEYYPRFSKSILDEIDTVLAEHYGFTDEELDFIINYDIKYRMGKEIE